MSISQPADSTLGLQLVWVFVLNPIKIHILGEIFCNYKGCVVWQSSHTAFPGAAPGAELQEGTRESERKSNHSSLGTKEIVSPLSEWPLSEWTPLPSVGEACGLPFSTVYLHWGAEETEKPATYQV